MNVTVSEASTKWCPMVRAPIQVGFSTDPSGAYKGDFVGGCNAGNSGYAPPDARCKANDCMMWRWDEVGSRGHCGLAGNFE